MLNFKRTMLCSLFLLQFTLAFAQLVEKRSYAKIAAGDSEADIIRKAANIRPSARQLRWQKLELTAFLHFGINTFTGREWGDGTESPAIFNPTELDARQWVRTCKEAGFKQVILTAKHHDGFCLWPSKYTQHSVKSSPWRNGAGDVVKEVADACHEYGIGFGIYLSPWDRNSSYFGTPAYNDYFIHQLTELLTQYGKVDELWFDGANGEGPGGKKQVYEFNRWYALIRKLQPSAVIAVMGPDVRWVGTESGYGRETEWSVVPGDALIQDQIAAASQKTTGFAPMNMMEDDLGSLEKITRSKSLVWYPAEIDVSIRPGWFYHQEEDSKVKSTATLMDIYYSSVGRNGVLLLNMPPDKRGLLTDYDVKALMDFKDQRDKVFSNNLVKAAKVVTKRNKDTTTMLLTLPEKAAFNLLVVQEKLEKGQRVAQFELEYMENGSWKSATKGTTIGSKRILNFTAVTAKELRLTVSKSRLKPVISEIGLYFQQPNP
ncbi:alpha-L-fucosidase [Pedobacter sp. MC2016-14]|uniref:alpha-L-fucosidase n=1 Tax=Pedobacter sp. MC2016-14 TaxID=2897327 RepID=UPI001E5073A7|nr:alpha-L-fucosidase [Pedobacter sp. MC2016-14]MCD0488702.1 alpha-L-fucosidase [Pedobacter sp. MC2016-14]